MLHNFKLFECQNYAISGKLHTLSHMTICNQSTGELKMLCKINFRLCIWCIWNKNEFCVETLVSSPRYLILNTWTLRSLKNTGSKTLLVPRILDRDIQLVLKLYIFSHILTMWIYGKSFLESTNISRSISLWKYDTHQ